MLLVKIDMSAWEWWPGFCLALLGAVSCKVSEADWNRPIDATGCNVNKCCYFYMYSSIRKSSQIVTEVEYHISLILQYMLIVCVRLNQEVCYDSVIYGPTAFALPPVSNYFRGTLQICFLQRRVAFLRPLVLMHGGLLCIAVRLSIQASY